MNAAYNAAATVVTADKNAAPPTPGTARDVPGGFPANSNATAAPAARPAGPIRWRLALLTLIAVYPVITVYLYALLPMTDGWETWQRTLVLAPLMIVSIVYGIAPLLQKHFGWFLRPQPRR
jgi:antibiotic biosynthesis monooxygenase (ABM) superfamily enzyme